MNEPLTQLHAEAMTAEREWTVEEIPVLSASISLPEPVPAADKVSRRIRRYYQLQCRSFLRYCETYLLPAAAEEYRAALAASLPLPHFRAELTYQVTYNDGGLWSLYTQSRESGFSGRPTLLRHGDTWDLTSGYPVPLSAFFPRRSGWKRRLMEAAEAEIQRQETAGISRDSFWAGRLFAQGVPSPGRLGYQPAEGQQRQQVGEHHQRIEQVGEVPDQGSLQHSPQGHAHHRNAGVDLDSLHTE